MARTLLKFLLVAAAWTAFWAAAAASASEAITQAVAENIAREAAGCDAARECVLRGGWRDGKWIFVVSFVAGRDPAGNPLFVPGGFIGVTVSRDGRVVDVMPGA